jgi:sugar lactone lactonase YvrE
VNLATGHVSTLYDSFEGEPLKGPNDIVFDAHGGFWFTDHGQCARQAAITARSITRLRTDRESPASAPR